jgi:hypothetical protein
MRLLAYILLFSFTFILLPKEWWHLDDHSANNHISHSTEKSFNHDDCVACDLDLSTFSFAISIIAIPVANSNNVSYTASESAFVSDLFLYFNRRGPPNLA